MPECCSAKLVVQILKLQLVTLAKDQNPVKFTSTNTHVQSKHNLCIFTQPQASYRRHIFTYTVLKFNFKLKNTKINVNKLNKNLEISQTMIQYSIQINNAL